MSGTSGQDSPANNKNLLIAAGIIAIVVIVIIAVLFFLPKTESAANETDTFNSAGALYSRSVDLANEGNYTEALDAADKALALNAPSLNPLIQSNRAGILVMLGRNEEAIQAADAAINAPGNLTTLKAIAWYNKGNALTNLGRTAEADAAYANATALDPNLTSPKRP